ncbi:MAG: hypothetical protein AAGF11_52700 [Myxococcota bacterium]
MRRIGLIVAAALVPLLGAGCRAPYKLEPPAGFAEVDNHYYGAHMKANNNVGLKISVFDNVKGGTLAFWARDMIDKLGMRGYELIGQSPTRSKNGVVGTRFDFRYTPVGKDEGPRFYTAVLFVSDEYKVVMQVAGREAYKGQYSAEIDAIAGELKVRGCKAATKACKGPQPERLSTPAPTGAPATEGNDSDGGPTKTANTEGTPAEPAPAGGSNEG